MAQPGKACGFLGAGGPDGTPRPSPGGKSPRPGSKSGAPTPKRKVENPEEEIQSLTLMKVMKDEVLFGLLWEFAVEELCGEMVMFWKETDDYAKLDSGSERREKLNNLWTNYIDPASATEMNMSGDHRAQFTRAYEAEGDPPQDMFDDVQIVLWVEMNTELYPRFLRSEKLRSFFYDCPDSPTTLRSRKKLEDFFGMEIKGNVTRSEVVKVVETTGFEKLDSKRRVKAARRHSFSGATGDNRASEKRQHSSSTKTRAPELGDQATFQATAPKRSESVKKIRRTNSESMKQLMHVQGGGTGGVDRKRAGKGTSPSFGLGGGSDSDDEAGTELGKSNSHSSINFEIGGQVTGGSPNKFKLKGFQSDSGRPRQLVHSESSGSNLQYSKGKGSWAMRKKPSNSAPKSPRPAENSLGRSFFGSARQSQQ